MQAIYDGIRSISFAQGALPEETELDWWLGFTRTLLGEGLVDAARRQLPQRLVASSPTAADELAAFVVQDYVRYAKMIKGELDLVKLAASLPMHAKSMVETGAGKRRRGPSRKEAASGDADAGEAAAGEAAAEEGSPVTMAKMRRQWAVGGTGTLGQQRVPRQLQQHVPKAPRPCHCRPCRRAGRRCPLMSI